MKRPHDVVREGCCGKKKKTGLLKVPTDKASCDRFPAVARGRLTSIVAGIVNEMTATTASMDAPAALTAVMDRVTARMPIAHSTRRAVENTKALVEELLANRGVPPETVNTPEVRVAAEEPSAGADPPIEAAVADGGNDRPVTRQPGPFAAATDGPAEGTRVASVRPHDPGFDGFFLRPFDGTHLIRLLYTKSDDTNRIPTVVPDGKCVCNKKSTVTYAVPNRRR